MEQLPLHRVEQIGLSAARSVAGHMVLGLKVRTALDSSDEPAYFLSFLAEQDQVAQVELGIRIAQKIRDDLIENGDGSYPYVRLLGQDDWDRR